MRKRTSIKMHFGLPARVADGLVSWSTTNSTLRLLSVHWNSNFPTPAVSKLILSDWFLPVYRDEVQLDGWEWLAQSSRHLYCRHFLILFIWDQFSVFQNDCDRLASTSRQSLYHTCLDELDCFFIVQVLVKFDRKLQLLECQLKHLNVRFGPRSFP